MAALEFKSQTYVKLFCGSPRTLHLGVMLGWCLFSQMEKSHMLRQNWGVGCGIQTVPASHIILSPLPCSYTMAYLCSPLKLLGHRVGLGCLRWQLLLVTAAGRKGRDTCLFRLLWKEAMALKVCPGSQSLSFGPGLPPTCTVEMLGCRAKGSNSQLWHFYLGLPLSSHAILGKY